MFATAAAGMSVGMSGLINDLHANVRWKPSCNRELAEAEMKLLLKRMIGAACLDAITYEQVEADSKSTGSAILVVFIASVAASVGVGSTDLVGIAGVTLAAFLSWMVWIGLTLLIGKWIMPRPETQTDFGEILRTTGFSAAPGVFRILAVIPGIGLPIYLGVTVWMLLTFVVAIRQALDYTSFSRALAVCLLGWAIHGILFFAFVQTAI
jgi:hypothetical protein